MRSSRAPRILGALVLVCATRTAWAQGSSAAPGAGLSTVATGRAAFDRGLAALDEQRFADAVAAFEESLRIRPLPVVTYNLGLAYRGLGRNQDAIAAFERYLHDPGGSAPTDTLVALREQLRQLRRSLVVLTVAAVPSTARVAIDGRDQANVGDEIVVDPGTHAVEVRAEGYRVQRQEISLPAAARITLNVQLESLEGTGRLLVEPSVLDAVVSIDGHRVGTGRVEQPVAAGDHVIEIRAAHYQTFRRTLHVGRLGMVRVDATLASEGTPGWVVPLVIVGAAAVVAGAVVTTVVVTNQPSAPVPGTWLTVMEMDHP